MPRYHRCLGFYVEVEIIRTAEPTIANLLSQLMQQPEIKAQTEELASDLSACITSEAEKKPMFFRKALNGIEKLVVLSDAYEKIQPLATALQGAVKGLALKFGICI